MSGLVLVRMSFIRVGITMDACCASKIDGELYDVFYRWDPAFTISTQSSILKISGFSH